MLNHLRSSSVFALFAVLSVACSNKSTKDGTNPAGSTDGGSTPTETPAADGGSDLGECVSYKPAEISGTKSGTFASADDIVKIKLPETDVGGGLLKVTYLADARPITGSLWLAEGSKKDVPRHETGAFGPGISDGATGVVYYRLAGKKSYEIGAKSFSFSDGEKNGYTVTYSYEPQIDCYEANDTLATAKRIPVNTKLTASLHTGFGPDDESIVTASGEDWYTFELATEKRVQLKATLPGKDGPDGKNPAFFTVLTADGATAASCETSGSLETDPVAPAEAVETCEGVLAAGKYFVKLAHFVSQTGATAVNTAPYKSWNTPYTFVVNAK
jgi:hypothetical protein